MRRLPLKIKKRSQTRSLVGDMIVYFIVFAISAFMAIPFIYAIAQSLKPMEEIFLFPPKLLVQNPTKANFEALFQIAGNLWVPFERYVFNSLFITMAATLAHVIFASMAAFVLAKFVFPGSKALSKIVVLSLLFVYEVTYVPQYILFSYLGIIDNYLVLLLPPIAAPLGLFLMQQFMSQLPDAIIESATVDGAGTFSIYWNIAMPNSKAAYMTLIIFSVQAIWNRDTGAQIFSEQLKVLPTILRQVSDTSFARAGVAAAAAVVIMIPPLILFILTQSRVLETMTHSGIKG